MKIIKSHVSLATDQAEYLGFTMIRIQDAGQSSSRYWTQQEIQERIAEGRPCEDWAGEGSAYCHIYTVASDVPVDIAAGFVTPQRAAA